MIIGIILIIVAILLPNTWDGETGCGSIFVGLLFVLFFLLRFIF